MKKKYAALTGTALLLGLCIAVLPAHIFILGISAATLFIFCFQYPRATMVALGLFLLFQDLIASQFSESSSISIYIKRSEEFVILVISALFIVKGMFLKRPWKASVIDLPLACLILLAIAGSVKNHIVPPLIASFDMFILLKGFLVYYIFYNNEYREKEIRILLDIFLTTALAIFIFGIVDLLMPLQFRSFMRTSAYIDYRFGIPSVQSFFIHPAVFGWFMAFCSTFALAFFIILRKYSNLVFAILFGIGSLLSLRVKPVIGLLASISTGFIMTPPSKKIRYIFIALLLVGGFTLLFGPAVKYLFEDKMYIYFQSSYSAEMPRNALYSASVRIAIDYFPLGSGLATFGGWISALYYSPIYYRYGLNAIYGLGEGAKAITDTFWPYILGQFGFIGALLYMFIAASLFAKLINGFRVNRGIAKKAFILGSIMAFAEGMIESIAEPVFLKPPHYFFIFAVLGISSSLSNDREGSEDINRQ